MFILCLRNAWTFWAEHLSLHKIHCWMWTNQEKYLRLPKSLRVSLFLLLGKLLLKNWFEIEMTFLLLYSFWNDSPVRRALNPLALTFPLETNLMVMYFFLDLKLFGLFFPQSQIWKYEQGSLGMWVRSNKFLNERHLRWM